jgi:hypothetical protein
VLSLSEGSVHARSSAVAEVWFRKSAYIVTGGALPAGVGRPSRAKGLYSDAEWLVEVGFGGVGGGFGR